MTFATFAEIAAELGVDERTVRRVVATVLRRMADETDASDASEVLRALIGVLREKNLSTETAAFSRVPRRFSAQPGSGPDHALRVFGSPRESEPDIVGRRRAGHLPRRWSKP